MSTATATYPTKRSDYRMPRLRLQPMPMLQVGIVTLAFAVGIAFAWGAWARLAHSYLLAIVFCLSISLGALFFVILQHLVGARWSVTVRRVAELLSSAIPWLGLMWVPVLVVMLMGDSHLYEWNDAELARTDKLIAHKSAYLNAPIFAIRCSIYFAVWAALSRFFVGKSILQDAGDGHATLALRRSSGPAMLAFALTVNFAAFDLLMSLDPHWFSTIFGIYFFAGCVVALFSALILSVSLLQAKGALRESVTVEHYHDLGKLLFGFVFFWGYIAFSQYLLIWYANIPEETVWYATRQQNGWQFVSVVLLFGHFLLPFVGLMSRFVRRYRKALVGWAVFLLAMHLVDLYWLIMPSASPSSALPSMLDALCVTAVGLIWLSLTLRVMTRTRLVSIGDPHLRESLAFRNV